MNSPVKQGRLREQKGIAQVNDKGAPRPRSSGSPPQIHPPVQFAFDSLLFTVPSLQTLCRLVIQRSVVHRLAIDGLHLPKGLKDFCKYE